MEKRKWWTTALSSENSHCLSCKILHDLALLCFSLGFHLVLSPAMPVKTDLLSIYLHSLTVCLLTDLSSLSLQALTQPIPARRVGGQNLHLGEGDELNSQSLWESAMWWEVLREVSLTTWDPLFSVWEWSWPTKGRALRGVSFRRRAWWWLLSLVWHWLKWVAGGSREGRCIEFFQ